MQGDHPLTAAALGLSLLAVPAGACGTGPVPAARVAAANDLNSSRERVGTEWAASSDRSARMVDAAAALGLPVAEFSKMLEAFAQDLERTNATATTPAQREYVAHLTRARDVYQDLLRLWQADGDAPHPEGPQAFLRLKARAYEEVMAAHALAY
jgi:hypothetical protein